MKYRSCHTCIPDPYRAGLDLGTALHPLHPEVVILFVTVHFQAHLAEVKEGLCDALGYAPVICGGTGDGIYETRRVANYGACALGIQSQGQVQWSLASQVLDRQGWRKAAAQAAEEAMQQLADQPCLGFVLADGAHADGSEIVAGIQQVLSVPFFGGLTADDRQFQRTALLVNEMVMERAVLVLLASGPLSFRIHATSGWTPQGQLGKVTHCEHNVIYCINDQPAVEFISEQLGKRLSNMDLGIVPLAEIIPSVPSQFILHSMSRIDPVSGSITLFGQVQPQAQVQICQTTVEDILQGVDQALEQVCEPGFHPEAALIISCAGRKWLLSENGWEELARIQRKLGDLPLIGFPSFGEISPLRQGHGYSPVYFHNNTFVLALLGSP